MSFSPVNPTAISGTVTLGSLVTLTGASGVFQSTGLSVILPEAGTYLVMADVRATINVSSGAGAFLAFELYNSIDAASIAGSSRFGPYAGAVNVPVISTTPIQKIVTVSASKVITLRASRNNTATYLNSSVDNGTTELSYVKLA